MARVQTKLEHTANKKAKRYVFYCGSRKGWRKQLWHEGF